MSVASPERRMDRFTTLTGALRSEVDDGGERVDMDRFLLDAFLLFSAYGDEKVMQKFYNAAVEETARNQGEKAIDFELLGTVGWVATGFGSTPNALDESQISELYEVFINPEVARVLPEESQEILARQ